jgi:diadenosine tetraphosphate (Ap4A) HIT family hydrolase
MIQASCALCGQIAGSEESNLLRPLLNTPWSRRPLLLEDDAGAVMPSLGALVPGHVLVCPREHVRSFASVDATARTSLAELTEDAVGVLEEQLSVPVHRFEHGSAAMGPRVACSIEHAHLHLLPADVSISSALGRLGPWIAVRSETNSLTEVVGSREYLLYGQPRGKEWVALAPAGGFPSQLMRRIFATALGAEERWNWREHSGVSNIEHTLEMFSVEAREEPLVNA